MEADTYMFGRTAEELQRLTRQAALMEAETEDMFVRAGITAGMRVLEIGSGAGDVAILLGKLVRPNGNVLAIERSADSVALATSRAAAIGNVAVSFEVADLESYEPSAVYDAVVGRYVLPYLADPSGVLRRLVSHVRPGGIVAFLEFDATQVGSTPEAPLHKRVSTLITQAFEATGIDPGLGSNLPAVFRKADLPWPNLVSFQKASCGPAGFYWLLAETVRTLVPHIVRRGLATAEELEVETLADRLCEEAIARQLTLFGPRNVGAWIRVPS